MGTMKQSARLLSLVWSLSLHGRQWGGTTGVRREVKEKADRSP